MMRTSGFSRRDLLQQSAFGLGSIALSQLLAEDSFGDVGGGGDSGGGDPQRSERNADSTSSSSDPMSVKPSHFP
ncbi:MAG: hypothetical protein ACK50J_12420, partial [Planctomyces sp.]